MGLFRYFITSLNIKNAGSFYLLVLNLRGLDPMVQIVANESQAAGHEERMNEEKKKARGTALTTHTYTQIKNTFFKKLPHKNPTCILLVETRVIPSSKRG